MDIERGKNDRLIIEMPPRHGKSELGSKYYPTYRMGHHPQNDIMLTSATGDLALNFSSATRDLLSEYGPSLFGTSIRHDRRSADFWRTTDGGACRAAGVGGNIIGHGARLAIVDDYFRSVQEALSPTMRDHVHRWFHGTLMHRLARGAAVVIICTRWHPKDLTGKLLEEAEHGGDKWRRISLPALATDDDPLGRRPGECLWPEFEIDGDKFGFGERWLEKRREAYYASGYPWMFEALYQQNPPEVLDAEWPAEYWDNVRFDEWPALDDTIMRVVALDPSLGKTDKADYSAFVMLAKTSDGRFWVDADLGRRSSSLMLDEGMRIMDDFRPFAFGCESNTFQELLVDGYRERMAASHLNVHAYSINNYVNKITRIRAMTDLFASGRVLFKSHSPGAELLLEQLRGFPSHMHDDGPDALEMAIRLCNELLTGDAETEEDYYSVPATT